MQRKFVWVLPVFICLVSVVTVGLSLLLPSGYIFLNRLGRMLAWLAFAGLYFGMLLSSVSSIYRNSVGSKSAALSNMSKLTTVSLQIAALSAIAHMGIMLFKQIGVGNLGGIPISFQYSIGLAAIALVLLLQLVLIYTIHAHRSADRAIHPTVSVMLNLAGASTVAHFWAIGQSLQFELARLILSLALITLSAIMGLQFSAWLSKRFKPMTTHAQMIALVVAVLLFVFVSGSADLIKNYSPDEGASSGGGHH